MEPFNTITAGLERQNRIAPPIQFIGFDVKSYNKLKPYNKSEPERRKTLNFGLFLSGKTDFVKIKRNGVEFTASLPAIFCAYPGPLFCTVIEPSENLYLGYAPESMACFPYFTDDPARCLLALPQTKRIYELISEIQHRCLKIYKKGGIDLLDICAASLIGEITMESMNAMMNETELLRIGSWLDEHFAENVNWEHLAKSYGLSLRNFQRKFLNTYNISPGEYLRRKRISEAKHLLQYTDLQIKTIAQMTGFSDPYYFSRVFHSVSGCSPKKYRNTE